MTGCVDSTHSIQAQFPSATSSTFHYHQCCTVGLVRYQHVRLEWRTLSAKVGVVFGWGTPGSCRWEQRFDWPCGTDQIAEWPYQHSRAAPESNGTASVGSSPCPTWSHKLHSTRVCACQASQPTAMIGPSHHFCICRDFRIRKGADQPRSRCNNLSTQAHTTTARQPEDIYT